jgi:hypothetical protein
MRAGEVQIHRVRETLDLDVQRLLTAALLVLAAARPASAEINMADSIEWETIDSDVVARGFVTKATKHDETKAVWYDLTFQVTESVKGGAKGLIHIGFRDFSSRNPEHWEKDKTDLLVILVDGKRARDDKELARMPFIPRPQNMSSTSIFELGKTQAFTSTFAVITKDTDVLAAVRTAAKSTATKSFRVDVPWDTAAQHALYGGSVVWMTVPVDATLEKFALAELASKSAWSRAEAAKALVHFRSDANIARVKKLLDDREFATESGTDRPPVKKYLVRAAAHETLVTWGIAHKTPILEEP